MVLLYFGLCLQKKATDQIVGRRDWRCEAMLVLGLAGRGDSMDAIRE